MNMKTKSFTKKAKYSLNSAYKALVNKFGIELTGWQSHLAAALYALLCPFWVVSLVALPYCFMSQTSIKDIGVLFGFFNGNALLLLAPVWFTFIMYFIMIGRTTKHKFIQFYNSYGVPPMIVLSFYFFMFAAGGIYPFGEKTIAWCDFTQQGVPYLMNFRSVLEGNDSLLLNMSNAGGMNAWSLLRSLFIHPLNYLILLVDRGKEMQFASLLTILKLTACSVTAMVFFKKCCKRLDTILAVPLAIMYSFCAFGGMYFQIVTWPDTMYLLPLFLTGLCLLIEKGSIVLYAISLALFISNISFGFMLVLTVIIMMAIYMFMLEDYEKIKKICFNFAGGTLLAVFLSAPFWISFFGDFGNSARGVNLQATLENSAFLTSRYTVYPLLLSTMFIFVAVIWMISHKKTVQHKAFLITFGLMMIPIIVEPINKMWHAGSYMSFPSRFAFILTFIGLILGAFALTNDEDELKNPYNKKKALRYILMGVITVVLVCLACSIGKFNATYSTLHLKEMSKYSSSLWGDEKSFKHILKLAIIVLPMYAIAFLLYKKRYLAKSALSLILVLLVLSEAFFSVNIYMVAASTKVNTEYFDLYADLGGKIEDEDFYRVKHSGHLYSSYTTSEANFPGAIGYNSTGHYSSLTDEDYLYAIKALGYSSMWMKIETYGGTELSDALLSMRYQFSKAKDDAAIYKNERYAIHKLPYYLPLGLMCEGTDFNLDLSTMERSEMQQKIFETITGSNDKLIIDYSPTELKGSKLAITEDGKNKITERGIITYTIDVEGKQTLYFDCFDEYSNSLSEDVNNSFSVKVKSEKVNTSYSQYPSSSYNKTNGFLKLGEFCDETVTISLTVNKNVTCRSFGVFGLDLNVLDNAIKNAKGANLNFDGDTVSGDFTAEKDGWMFVSLPYGTNLVYEVNGEEVEATKAFYGFTAIPIKAGKNSINVHGKGGLISVSLVVTAITIVSVIALIILFKKKNIALNLGFDEKLDALFGAKFAGFKSVIGTIVQICIIVAFFIVIALVYLYPMYTLLASQVA